MDTEYTMRPIARIHTVFQEKFGIPRQSGLADTTAEIVFLPEFSHPEAVRGLDMFSHIWLVWCFSEHTAAGWHATVRPPRMGGNRRMGVFATRSPFRPNPIGLSCVTLTAVEQVPGKGPVLRVRGADLMDGTPILDIKPYLPYTDSHPAASAGEFEMLRDPVLTVDIPEELRLTLGPETENVIREVLQSDPRPSYQNDPDRLYGIRLADREVRFRIAGDTVHVAEITPVSDTSTA